MKVTSTLTVTVSGISTTAIRSTTHAAEAIATTAADLVVTKALGTPEKPPEQLWIFQDNLRQQPEIDQVHGKTNGFDRITLKPLAKGYQAVMPNFMERGVHNFLRNLLGPMFMVGPVANFPPPFVPSTTIGADYEIKENQIFSFEPGARVGLRDQVKVGATALVTSDGLEIWNEIGTRMQRV